MKKTPDTLTPTDRPHAKRTHYLKIRLTLLEKRLIEQKARHAGMQTAPFCRSAALRRKITFKLTPDELAHYQMLVKYHNNFKSIANLVKKRDPELAGQVATTAAEILEHLKKFR